MCRMSVRNVYPFWGGGALSETTVIRDGHKVKPNISTTTGQGEGLIITPNKQPCITANSDGLQCTGLSGRSCPGICPSLPPLGTMTGNAITPSLPGREACSLVCSPSLQLLRRGAEKQGVY